MKAVLGMTPGEAFEGALASGNRFDEKIPWGRILEEFLGMTPGEAFEGFEPRGCGLTTTVVHQEIPRLRSREGALGMTPGEAFEGALWPGSLGELHDQNDGEEQPHQASEG